MFNLVFGLVTLQKLSCPWPELAIESLNMGTPWLAFFFTSARPWLTSTQSDDTWGSGRSFTTSCSPRLWSHVHCTLCMLTTLPLELCCPTKVWPSLLMTFATPRRCPAWWTALKFSKMPIGTALRHLRLNTSKAKSILISRKRKPFTLVLKLGSVIIDQVKPSNT